MNALFSLVCVVVMTVAAQSMAAAAWVNISNGLSGDINVIAAAPGRDFVVAGAANKSGLYATTDGGATWVKLGAGGQNETTQIVFDPEAPDTFWVCGIYGSAVCVTHDGGATFQEMGTLSHNDGLGVDFTDPLRRTVVVGGHETKQLLNKTTDNGADWTNIGANLPDSASLVVAPVVIDSLTYVIACSGWSGTGSNGIWRTIDGGATWTAVSNKAACHQPFVSSDGTIWYTILYDNGLVKSTDQGVHWTQEDGYGVIHSVPVTELPDGRIVGSSFSTNGLSAAPHLGFGFKNVGPRTAAQVGSVCYNAVRKAFFVSCPGSGTYRLDYDSTVIASTEVPMPAQAQNGSENVFRCCGSTFTIPDGLAARTATVALYSADGRLIVRVRATRGETITLPRAHADALFVARVESADRR